MKIAVIGGAGVRTVIFVNGLLNRYEGLGIDEVMLYDIDGEKQEIIGRLCRQVVARRGESLKITIGRDPVTTLQGADYVVTTIRVGGDHARVVDESLALARGVIGQETTGIGGFSMAVRTIPVLLDYCALIRVHAPNAWVFNFSNPSGLVTQALQNAGFDRIIGICDAPSSTRFRMAQQLGVTEHQLVTEFFGLNHLSWIRSVRLDGEEILPRLLGDDGFLRNIQEFSIFDPELLRSLGFLPNEYLYYYYHRERVLKNLLGAGALRGKSIETVNRDMMQALKAMDMDRDPEEALQTFLYYMQVRENSYMRTESGTQAAPPQKGALPIPEGIGYAGVMLDCIEGLQGDTPRDLVLSVPNRGSIPFLSEEDVVEMSCRVSREGGIQPIRLDAEEIPVHCQLLIRQIKYYERCTVEYIRTKNPNIACHGLMAHPLVNSFSLAKTLLRDYQSAYPTWLA